MCAAAPRAPAKSVRPARQPTASEALIRDGQQPEPDQAEEQPLKQRHYASLQRRSRAATTAAAIAGSDMIRNNAMPIGNRFHELPLVNITTGAWIMITANPHRHGRRGVR